MLHFAIPYFPCFLGMSDRKRSPNNLEAETVNERTLHPTGVEGDEGDTTV